MHRRHTRTNPFQPAGGVRGPGAVRRRDRHRARSYAPGGAAGLRRDAHSPRGTYGSLLRGGRVCRGARRRGVGTDPARSRRRKSTKRSPRNSSPPRGRVRPPRPRRWPSAIACPSRAAPSCASPGGPKKIARDSDASGTSAGANGPLKKTGFQLNARQCGGLTPLHAMFCFFRARRAASRAMRRSRSARIGAISSKVEAPLATRPRRLAHSRPARHATNACQPILAMISLPRQPTWTNYGCHIVETHVDQCPAVSGTRSISDHCLFRVHASAAAGRETLWHGGTRPVLRGRSQRLAGVRIRRGPRATARSPASRY